MRRCAGSNYTFLTQKERDSETGLDYFGARYYGSAQGRFTSVDPVTITEESFLNPQRLNLYAYVNNNPLAAVDPGGSDGAGKGGDKVISVFLNLSQEDARDPVYRGVRGRPDTFRKVGYAPGPWQGKGGAETEASANGYDVELYGSSDMTGNGNQPITSSAFESALKNSEVVIYAGHGGQTDTGEGTDASPVHQGGIQVGDTSYYPNGSQRSTSPLMGAKPDAGAKVVVNFSCDANRNGGSYFNFTGKGQLMVTINSGKNGVTNAGTIEKAAAAFAKTYAATPGNYEAKAKAAAAAANQVVLDSYKKHKDNVGDHVDQPQKVN